MDAIERVASCEIIANTALTPAQQLKLSFSGEHEGNDALQSYIKSGEKFRKMELLPVFYFKEDPDQIRFSSYCLVPRPIFSA